MAETCRNLVGQAAPGLEGERPKTYRFQKAGKGMEGFSTGSGSSGIAETLKGMKSTDGPGLNEMTVLSCGSKQLESPKKTFDKRTFSFGEHGSSKPGQCRRTQRRRRKYAAAREVYSRSLEVEQGRYRQEAAFRRGS